MANPIDLAVAEKLEHPDKSYQRVAAEFGVSKSTLHSRHTGAHSSHASSAPRHLSEAQEMQLVDKINMFAGRGTLLSTQNVKEYAEAICGHSVGKNWVSTFVKRHRHTLVSRYWRYQDKGRFDAASIENLESFFKLLEELRASGHYHRDLLFNADESGFQMTSNHKMHRVGPRGHPIKGQVQAPPGEHITVMACIGTESAPVPPLVIYKGAHLQESWTAYRDPTGPKQLAVSTHSGWINATVMVMWLEQVFDPATQDISHNGRRRRILFLDGAESHVKVAFLDACWARNITVVILPAKASDTLQPLDVNFFGALKKAYHDSVDQYMLGSVGRGPNKGMFWKWHQAAWEKATNQRQIRSAWKKSGLWPLDKSVPASRLRPPPVVQAVAAAGAPLQPLDLNLPPATRSGEKISNEQLISCIQALKSENQHLKTEIAVLKLELEGARKSQEMDKAARGSKKKQRYPLGQVFNPEYEPENRDELGKRRRAEEEASEKKRSENTKKRRSSPRRSARACTPGPSGTS